MMVYVSTFSILWGVLNPITTWQSLGIIQCPLRIGTCRRSLESCLGRGCAWHRARFLRGTKRSGMSKLKECHCGCYSQSKDQKDQKVYCIETELSKHKTWVHVWLSWILGVSPVPLFLGPFLPRRNTIATIAWRTSSWRNWRRPHRRAWIREVDDFVLFHFYNTNPEKRLAVLGKGWQFRSLYP